MTRKEEIAILIPALKREILDKSDSLQRSNLYIGDIIKLSAHLVSVIEEDKKLKHTT